MCVQPSALGRKGIQYMVLYCLTAPPFHRYSWLNLCPPNPARDGIKPDAHFAEGKGIRVVNRSSGCTKSGCTKKTGCGSHGWSHECSPGEGRYPSGAKAHVFFGWRAARVKPCPTRSQCEITLATGRLATDVSRSSRCLN